MRRWRELRRRRPRATLAHSEELHVQACTALGFMTRGSAEDQTRAVHAGAVEAVNRFWGV